jgi:membrane protease YdiL (CAAX protease family)
VNTAAVLARPAAPHTPPAIGTDRVVVTVAWTALLTASALPQIVLGEVASGVGLWPIVLGQLTLLAGLLMAARSVTRLSSLVRPAQWLLAMAIGWHVVVGGVTHTDAWQNWQHGVPWVVRGAVVQVLLFTPTAFLVAFGPGRLGRKALRLCSGDETRHAAPSIYTARRRPSWRQLGWFWGIGITAGTATAMWFALGSRIDSLTVLVWSLPFIAVLAATNTFNEEFGYRNVPLAVLPAAVGTRSSVAMTGLLFGLAHYYGNPPAASGVALATFLGVLLAKSMIDTGGSRWAWRLHWLQDMVIFSFLTLAWEQL